MEEEKLRDVNGTISRKTEARNIGQREYFEHFLCQSRKTLSYIKDLRLHFTMQFSNCALAKLIYVPHAQMTFIIHRVLFQTKFLVVNISVLYRYYRLIKLYFTFAVSNTQTHI